MLATVSACREVLRRRQVPGCGRLSAQGIDLIAGPVGGSPIRASKPAAMMLPETAIPSAAPSSRAVSLTAEPTPGCPAACCHDRRRRRRAGKAEPHSESHHRDEQHPVLS